MLTIDAFPFNNELDLLEIRLNHLNNYVDYFVITEANTNFAGEEKDLYFENNKKQFASFSHKIIHQVVDVPSKLSPFERDWYQRNEAKNVIAGIAKSDSFIIYGDVDELPSYQALEHVFISDVNLKGLYHFAQDLFYYYFNLKESSGKLLSHIGEYPFRIKKKWLGTVGGNWDYIKEFEMTQLRDPFHKSNSVRIKEGGWHFSYVSSDGTLSTQERIALKIKSNAHQEFNLPKYLNKIENNVTFNKDIFGRRGVKFEVLDDLSYLPEYIIRNISKFSHQFKDLHVKNEN